MINKKKSLEFERFLGQFSLTGSSLEELNDTVIFPLLVHQVKGAVEFLTQFGGCSFNNGLYRVHLPENINKWTLILKKCFPEINSNLVCFAYDWLGRQFALSSTQTADGKPLILRFDVSTDEALKIPASFQDFHNFELVDYPNDALDSDLFTEWESAKNREIQPDQCVGYKHPPFLSGLITVDNLQVRNLEVYWGILGQLLVQVRNLPAGAKISQIEID